jgi:hypothetical protein
MGVAGFWSTVIIIRFLNNEQHYTNLAAISFSFLFSYTMFTGQEWKLLAEITGMPFRNVVQSRDTWDLKWKTSFEELLNDEVRCKVD